MQNIVNSELEAKDIKISLITKLFLIFMKFVSWAGISIVFSVR